MGQLRYLWEHNIVLRKKVDFPKQEKDATCAQSDALAAWKTKAIEDANRLGTLIMRWEGEKDQLQWQLDEAQATRPVQPTPPSSASAADAIRPWKDEADRLDQDCTRICQERNHLRSQNNQLWEQVQQMQQHVEEMQDERFKAEATMEGLMKLARHAESRTTTPTWATSGTTLPSHEKIGGHRIPSTTGPTTPLPTTPGGGGGGGVFEGSPVNSVWRPYPGTECDPHRATAGSDPTEVN